MSFEREKDAGICSFSRSPCCSEFERKMPVFFLTRGLDNAKGKMKLQYGLQMRALRSDTHDWHGRPDFQSSLRMSGSNFLTDQRSSSSKMALGKPKMAKDTPRRARHGPQLPAGWFQDGPKEPELAPRWLPDSPRAAPRSPQAGPGWPPGS